MDTDATTPDAGRSSDTASDDLHRPSVIDASTREGLTELESRLNSGWIGLDTNTIQTGIPHLLGLRMKGRNRNAIEVTGLERFLIHRLIMKLNDRQLDLILRCVRAYAVYSNLESRGHPSGNDASWNEALKASAPPLTAEEAEGARDIVHVVEWGDGGTMASAFYHLPEMTRSGSFRQHALNIIELDRFMLGSEDLAGGEHHYDL